MPRKSGWHQVPQKQHAKQRWLKRQDSPRPRPAGAWIPHGGREHCKGWMSLDPRTTANVDGRLENKNVYKVSSALWPRERISLRLGSNKLKYLGIKTYVVSNLP